MLQQQFEVAFAELLQAAAAMRELEYRLSKAINCHQYLTAKGDARCGYKLHEIRVLEYRIEFEKQFLTEKVHWMFFIQKLLNGQPID